MKALDICVQNFQPYGTILHTSDKEKLLDNKEMQYTNQIGIINVSPVSTGILVQFRREIIVNKLERHLSTPEMIVALENDSILFLAEPSTNIPQTNMINAFRLKAGQAVLLKEGCWHWGPFPYKKSYCKSLIAFKKDTETNDCEQIELKDSIRI
jgi:ureidoglycolate hydrolase